MKSVDALSILALALLGLAHALLAVGPSWLITRLRASIERDKAYMATTGKRNVYIGPETDSDRFLRELRIMAAFGAALFFGIAAWAVVYGF